MSRIFIVPQHGKYEGQLLVFDHVESINHVSNSTIPQHPVESGSKSIADHRYKQPFKLSIVGNVSDQWNTKATILPVSVFQTTSHKMQKILRQKVAEVTGEGSVVRWAVNNILDKEFTEQDDPRLLTALERISENQVSWVTRAFQLTDKEADTLDTALEKGMSLSYEIRNTQRLGSEINTIAQAEEMLTHLDNNNILVTVYSLYRTYENMVIQSFRNDTRQGAQRGAYWVSIDFEQQLLAQTVTKPISISLPDTEETNEKTDLGKQVPKRELDKATLDKATQIAKERLALFEGLEARITKEDFDAVVVKVAETFAKAGGFALEGTARRRAVGQADLSFVNLLKLRPK